MKRGVKLEIGPVRADTDEPKIELLKMGDENWRIRSIIWKDCLPLLKKENQSTKTFIVGHYGVK